MAKISYPTGKKGESSGKQLTATAKTDFIQDKYTRMFFVVERCPSNLRWSNEENWKTVMVDQGVGSDPTDPDYAPKYPTEEKDTEGNLVNPEFRSWDTEATELTKRNFRYYGSDYTYEPLTETTNEKGDIEYVAKMSLTYYPGQVLVPGYYYRIRALMFQYDEHWENPTLVSLEDEKSENQYASSTTWIWQKYEYNANDLPVKVTNVIRDKNSISATVRAANQGFYLDHHYYVRLWKYDTSTNQWVIQEDTKYYGQIDKKSLMQTALQVNKSYSLTFQGLDPGTEYELRFYGLMDSDYDNHLNIAGDTKTPLEGQDNIAIYGNLSDYYNKINTSSPEELTNNLQNLYKTYLNINSYNDAATLKIADNDNAEKVLLNASSVIRTFDNLQTATIGNWYETKVYPSAHQFCMYFENASGLSSAETIAYTIKYFGNVESVTGEITRQGNAGSPMDGGKASGDVSLTITDNRLQLTNKGTYSVQLEIRDANGNLIEKPASIIFDVD